ncbi:MAG: hypothetical protein KDB72_18830 [Mycobacterium sp.]|nr:hypothetical protein [Mycobacterium sp.]
MRTAVVRVDVDPSGELSPEQLTAGVATLRTLAGESGIDLVDNNIAAMPRGRREAEMLMIGADPEELQRAAITMCANAFGTEPAAGTMTFVSRGTDEDAHGVLAGFGLTGQIDRTPGDDGYDIIQVTLRKADMERIPESRVFTALEASTNCEVHIRTV